MKESKLVAEHFMYHGSPKGGGFGKFLIDFEEVLNFCALLQSERARGIDHRLGLAFVRRGGPEPGKKLPTFLVIQNVPRTARST